MAKLYVTGARQRDLLFRREEEWDLYEAGVILQLDTESGAVRTCVEYQSPPEARAGEYSSMVFRSGTLFGDLLYTGTSTEAMIFHLPDFRRVSYVSLPCFNDIHHVTRSLDGSFLAAVTGLDMVIKFTEEGKILNSWNALPEPLWSRFSQDIDYRKVATTKPHKSHPNFVFELEDEVWATRFRQRDAICLANPGKRIEIKVQSPHDGLVFGENIYFSTVDGQVVVVNRRTLQMEKCIDLKQIDGKQSLLGWCRGLLPVDETKMWVAFSRIRKTRLLENVLWVRSVFREGMREKPTHIALYDLAEMRCLQEFDLEAHGVNLVYGIFSWP
jgi:hypothetical protein